MFPCQVSIMEVVLELQLNKKSGIGVLLSLQ